MENERRKEERVQRNLWDVGNSVIGNAGPQGRLMIGLLTLFSPFSLAIALLGGLMTVGSSADLWSPIALAAAVYNVIWTALLVIFYAPHMLGNPRIEGWMQGTWAFAFLFAAPLALPLYWLVHIRLHEAVVPDDTHVEVREVFHADSYAEPHPEPI